MATCPIWKQGALELGPAPLVRADYRVSKRHFISGATGIFSPLQLVRARGLRDDLGESAARFRLELQSAQSGWRAYPNPNTPCARRGFAALNPSPYPVPAEEKVTT